MTNSARTIVGGYTTHPESGADLIRVMVDQTYANGGLRCDTTDIWVERSAPVPALDEVVEWDHRHAWIRGIRYRKAEYDSPTDMPLH